MRLQRAIFILSPFASAEILQWGVVVTDKEGHKINHTGYLISITILLRRCSRESEFPHRGSCIPVLINGVHKVFPAQDMMNIQSC